MFQKSSVNLPLPLTLLAGEYALSQKRKTEKYLTENLIWIWGVVVFILAVPLRGILILYCLLHRKAEFCCCGWEYSFHMEAFAIC